MICIGGNKNMENERIIQVGEEGEIELPLETWNRAGVIPGGVVGFYEDPKEPEVIIIRKDNRYIYRYQMNYMANYKNL